MKVARRVAEARAALEDSRATVGLVPTMGALHAGHRSLVEAARDECDFVVVSLFVNPAQFASGEEAKAYPRDEAGDLAKLEEAGVDLVFLPAVDEIYPPGFQTWVDVTDLSTGLEGEARPGHFRGVATVCLMLFNIVRPDRAYFGRKDAQQAQVVGRLIRDLHLPIELRVLPTVRDEDGVALSSRNVNLSAEQREAARALPRALLAGAEAHRQGGNPVSVAYTILLGERRLDPDYVELVRWNGSLVLAAAVNAGETRLIDNVVLEEEDHDG